MGNSQSDFLKSFQTIADRGRHEIKTPDVILGYKNLPTTGHTANWVSILNVPSNVSGHIYKIALRLGDKPIGDGRNWHLLLCSRHLTPREGNEQLSLVTFKILDSIQIYPKTEDRFINSTQIIKLYPKTMRISQGQFLAVVNQDGPLAITFHTGFGSHGKWGGQSGFIPTIKLGETFIPHWIGDTYDYGWFPTVLPEAWNRVGWLIIMKYLHKQAKIRLEQGTPEIFEVVLHFPENMFRNVIGFL